MTAPIFGQSPKQRASQWAREMLAKPIDKVLILDTETCALNGEVIELAIINTSGAPLYNQRFNPLTPIHPGAQAVHGLTREMLRDEPRFAAEYDQICTLLEQAEIILIYNDSFDVACFKTTCQWHQVPAPEFKTGCIMRWYAQWYGEPGGFNGYKWQKLTGGDHSALGDARAALVMLRKMAEEGQGQP